MVKEPIEEVVARAAAYRYRVMQGPGVVRGDTEDISSALRMSGSGSVKAPRGGHEGT